MRLKFPVFLGINDYVIKAGVFTRSRGSCCLDDPLLGLVLGSQTTPTPPSRKGYVQVLKQTQT